MKLQTSPIGVQGYYRIEAHQETESGIQHSRRVVADWFPNLITDGGLDMIKTGGFMNACQVGSGTAPPSFGDTALQARIAGVGILNGRPDQMGISSSSSAPYYSEAVATYTFPQGAAAGNLSEIGISSGPATALFSRARILDGSGNPTTITILAIEVLTVTYAFRMYRSAADVVGSFIVNGVTYNTISRASYISSANPAWITNYFGIRGDSDSFGTSNGPIGAVTGGIPFSGAAAGTAGSGSPTFGPSGQYWMQRTFNFSIAQGNEVGGIASASNFRTDNRGITTQIGFTPPLPKDNTKTLAITVLTTWARYP